MPTTQISDKNKLGYSSAKQSVAFAFPHQGIIRTRGADTLDLLNRLSTNELTKLLPNQGIRTVLTSDKGRIVDILTVVVNNEGALLLCSQNNESNVVAWLRKYTIMDNCKVATATSEYCAVEILGPEAASLIQELSGETLLDIPMSHWRMVTVFGESALLLRQPATNDFSFLLLFSASQNDMIKGKINELSSEVPILTDEEYELLRIEAGMGVFGAELTDAYNPLEAGLLHLVNFKKGCYIGQEVIARIDSYNKVKQRVMGFTSKVQIPVGGEIRVENTTVGKITSSCLSPEFGWIALGYIRGEHAHPQSVVMVQSGDDTIIEAVIVGLPF
ncbi:MAG: aminomethyltransferase family protein [Bacteroidetes bacterium]|nr:aminomethyltransferase family protein [Bacteroidota bacterium]